MLRANLLYGRISLGYVRFEPVKRAIFDMLRANFALRANFTGLRASLSRLRAIFDVLRANFTLHANFTGLRASLSRLCASLLWLRAILICYQRFLFM